MLSATARLGARGRVSACTLAGTAASRLPAYVYLCKQHSTSVVMGCMLACTLSGTPVSGLGALFTFTYALLYKSNTVCMKSVLSCP
ncbi:hypothetical protein COO60DRAFT_1556046 [Scenedesmus sp. NREL 46B-D3]|nr:hypothetical protein COO60DRAFT_1556046 [Scenedesmus sp. NREL 46B-D3]